LTRRHNDDLQEMLDELDIEQYLDAEGITYKHTHGASGPQLNVRACPACGDHKYKVYINAETGLGNCFSGSCPLQTFNKWSFIKACMGDPHNGEVFAHIKRTARDAGWRARRTVSAPVEIETSEVRLPDSQALPINGKNLRYLAERRIDIDTARFFNLRYSSNGIYWYRADDAVRYQKYVQRVVIPIFDIDGGLLTFQGRDITGKAERKYLFPPGLPATGSHLFNVHNAVGSRTVVVGEGVFDAMSIKVAFDSDIALRGVAQLATFGKHLAAGSAAGRDQLHKFMLLKQQGLQEVILMWDSEFDALLAAFNAGVILKGIGLHVRVARLPAGRDPNEVSPSVVREAYWQAVSLEKRALALKKLLCPL
jgi:DNA primase